EFGMRHICRLTTGLAIALSTAAASASIVNYNGDFDGWKTAVAQSFTTCDFTGFPLLTIIDDEYSGLGVLFTDPGPNFVLNNPTYFPQDGWGIDSNGYVEVKFTQGLMHAIGGHVPGSPIIQLFLGDVMIAYGQPSILVGPQFMGLV